MAERQDIVVEDNPEASRFEARVGDDVAVCEYRLASDVVIFTHTEVPRNLEGMGVGGALVRGALEHARAHGYSVAPLCPFVASWIRRHPEFTDLVRPQLRYLVR